MQAFLSLLCWFDGLCFSARFFTNWYKYGCWTSIKVVQGVFFSKSGGLSDSSAKAQINLISSRKHSVRIHLWRSVPAKLFHANWSPVLPLDRFRPY
ncbi:hypothetical protein FB567DRAFT_182301 [Paraphoma chrysanthemicola]|uniref:Secreted protein n=1 Tax=Paraphoma chrysanthemicola TaxID=798071 RepID=A0A8K0QW12_9PLEO|nr:hypothetical protein FB567DRAFT_182301 [Paraphoma chrysanthemicola]